MLIAAQHLQLLVLTAPARPSCLPVLVCLHLYFLGLPAPDHVFRIVFHLVGLVLKVLGTDMPNGHSHDTDDIGFLPTVAVPHSLH